MVERPPEVRHRTPLLADRAQVEAGVHRIGRRPRAAVAEVGAGCGGRHHRAHVLRPDEAVHVGRAHAHEDLPHAVALLEDVEVAALVPVIQQFRAVAQAVHDRPLRLAERARAFDLDDRVRDRVHAGVDLLQNGDHVVAEFVRVAAEEAVVVEPVVPVAGLECLEIAAIGGATVAVDDVADGFAVAQILEVALESGQSCFDARCLAHVGSS